MLLDVRVGLKYIQTLSDIDFHAVEISKYDIFSSGRNKLP